MAAAAAAKGIAVAATSGAASYLLCSFLAPELPGALTAAAVGLSAVGGFLAYARVWIQGFYFDKRCTATADLSGRVALITGGTEGGLGFEAAMILAKMGATVVVTVRTPAKGQAAVEKIKRSAGNERVSFLCADFLSVGSIRRAAAEISSKFSRIDMLVL